MKNEFMEKMKYGMLKLIQMMIVMLLLSMIVFAMSRLSPGDPLKAYYGDSIEHMNQIEKENARENLGLNEPIIKQYLSWADNFIQGDLGISYKYKQPVSEVIEQFYGNTLMLGGVAFILIFGLAITVGVVCSLKEGTALDKIICKIGVVSNCIPSFFMAMLLILIFAVDLKIFPTSGAYYLGGEGSFIDRVYHLVLPVTVLVLEHLWYYAYMIRNKLLTEIRQDYVLSCKSRGMSNKRIVLKHCLKNIAPSIFAIMAVSLPHILGGTYIVEMIFSYPGLGTLSFESAKYQDYNMLMALVMITGIVVLLFNATAEILGEIIDPRMGYERIRNNLESEVTAHD